MFQVDVLVNMRAERCGQLRSLDVQGNWRFEGDSFPTIAELVTQQENCGEPVTKKSQAVLRRAITREQWELNNDEVALGIKIGNVSTCHTDK